MRPVARADVPAFAEYERLLSGMELEPLERFEFYDTARERDLSC